MSGKVKAWCYYESRLLGAHHGLLSTYALETMVLYLLNSHHHELNTPLKVSKLSEHRHARTLGSTRHTMAILRSGGSLDQLHAGCAGSAQVSSGVRRVRLGSVLPQPSRPCLPGLCAESLRCGSALPHSPVFEL